MRRLKHRFPDEQDESTSLRSLMLLDKLNPCPRPVWYADQGAIVEMLKRQAWCEAARGGVMSKGTDLVDALTNLANEREFEEGSGRSDPQPRLDFMEVSNELRTYVAELEELLEQAAKPEVVS